jgi:hypothetical protein
MVLALAMFMWAGSAFAYTIDDMYSSDWTLIRSDRYGSPYNWNGSTEHDVIGEYGVGGNPEGFQVHGIDVEVDDDNNVARFHVYTNYDNWANTPGYFPVASKTTYLTDMAIDIPDSGGNLTKSFGYGARVLYDPNDPNGGTDLYDSPYLYNYGGPIAGNGKSINKTLVAGVYEVATDGWVTSEDLWDGTGYIYGGRLKDANDGINTWQKAYTAMESVQTGPLGGSWIEGITEISGNDGTPGNPKYKWTVVMQETAFSNIAATNPGFRERTTSGNVTTDTYTMGLFFGGATCANDSVYGEVEVVFTDTGGSPPPIPEPGTLLLLGFGLLGLAGYGMLRKKKS